MANLLKLAIVGRPNVGKSALFNRICNKRLAIVDEAEGVTRDRLYTKADFFGMPFELIDTGGIHGKSQAQFNSEIIRQAEIAIEEADSIVLVVDAKIGPTQLDVEVARTLLKTKKPLCIAANKIDDPSQEHLCHQFRSLGIPHIVAVSAEHGFHIAELLETAFSGFNQDTFSKEEKKAIHVAVLGRPNVGKSSLLNYILDEERCIVSPIAGTTRDSIDIAFTHEDKEYLLIDTAGIRRKGSEHEVVDKFAAIRTERALERADVCLLILDSQQGLTTQEKKIANAIEEAGKGCILLFNKWDLVKGFRMEHCMQGIERDVPFLAYCPKLFISAKTGRNVEKIFSMINEVYQGAQRRITTHELNKFIESSLQKNHPPMIMGKRLRIYYMAQVEIAPPVFVLFVNYPNLMLDTYKKYLYNQFRETYGFLGSPIRFRLKGKKREKKPLSKATFQEPQEEPQEDLEDFDFEDDFPMDQV